MRSELRNALKFVGALLIGAGCVFLAIGINNYMYTGGGHGEGTIWVVWGAVAVMLGGLAEFVGWRRPTGPYV
jgi:hypothetical protein